MFKDIATTILAVVTAIMIVVTVALSVAVSYLIKQNYSETQRITAIVEMRTDSLCAFFQPLVPIQPAANSSKAGVQLLIGSRIAYTGLGCPGKIPPISSELINLAKKYNIQIPR